MFQTKVAEEITTHFNAQYISLRHHHHHHHESRAFFLDNVEKYCRLRQAIDYKMAHAPCIQGNSGYKNTLRIPMLNLFPFQQWLNERASLVRYIYTACLFKYQKAYTNLTIYTSLQYEMARNTSVLFPAKQI
jgi:hypothetical protein